MAFHLVAYYQSVDEGGVYTEIDPVQDESVRVEGKQIFVPKWSKLLGFCAFLGSTANSAYLDAPSLRRLSLFYLAPINTTTTPDANCAVGITGKILATLEEGEGVKFVAKADPAAAEPHSCILWFADEEPAPVSDPFTALEFSTSGTVTAGKWSNLAMTPVQALPVGRYQVVGAHVVASGGLAYRLIFVGEDHRPGGLCAMDRQKPVYIFGEPGRLGVWGTFHTSTPPTLQLLSSNTNLPTRVVLWLKKE